MCKTQYSSREARSDYLSCIADDSQSYNQLTLFHYTPTPALSYLFLALFGMAAVIHTFLGFKYNMRYLVWSAAICGYLEVTGWIGRLLGALDRDSQSLAPYLLKYEAVHLSPRPN